MLLPPAAPLSTTTQSPLFEDSGINTVKLASVSDLFVGDSMVIGSELVRVTAIGPDNVVEIRRGTEGTPLSVHAVGSNVHAGPSEEFEVEGGQSYRAGYNGVLGQHARMSFPLLSIYRDADNGYEYRLCRSDPDPLATNFAAGDWIVVEANGIGYLAKGFGEARREKGYVGIAIEAVPTGSFCWVLVDGQYVGAKGSNVVYSTSSAARSILALDNILVGELDVWTVTNQKKIPGVIPLSTSSGGLFNVLLTHPFSEGNSVAP